MRRGEPQTLQSNDFLKCFEQLDKRTFAIHRGKFMTPIKVDDLAEQSDFLDALFDEGPDFTDNFMQGPASLMPASEGDDAERACCSPA
jgi:hypothetical protein